MTTQQEIQERIVNIIIDLLPGVDPSQIDSDTDIFALGMDSLNTMSLLEMLQSEFSVVLAEEDITMENFRTVGCLSLFVARKQGVGH